MTESPVGFERSRFGPSVLELGKGDVWTVKKAFFTAVFPPGEEPDPAIIEECRRHDPNFVVVWGVKVMLTPANTEEITGNYVICRYVPVVSYLNDDKPPIKLENWPLDFLFDPKQIFELESWTIKWPKESWGAKLGIPEPAKPFDGRVVEYVKAQEDFRNNYTVADIQKMIDTWRERDEAELKFILQEGEYALKQELAGIRKAVEEGRILPPQYEGPQPFVYVNASKGVE